MSDSLSQAALSRAALSSFSAYAKIVHGYRPARHHGVWIDAFEDIAREKLLITCPPEHAKTTYAAVLLPALMIARNPNIRIGVICATEASAIARSRSIRSLIDGDGNQSSMYRYLFPHVMQGPTWSDQSWTVRRDRMDDPNPTVFACGTLSDSLIGRRLDLIIVDDPMTEEIARSELQRDSLKTWTKRTLLSRYVEGPGNKFICIMTRWHLDDMAQTLIDMDFDPITMPAYGYWDDPGQPLWPERFGIEYLETKRQHMGSALFDCMYMNDPAGLGGNTFQKSWFPVVENSDVPSLQYIVSGYDLAISTSSTADYTVKTTLGVGSDENYYVLDVWRERRAWPEVMREIKEQGKRDAIRACGVESVSFQLAAVQQLRSSGTGFPVIEIGADTDKVSRAIEWAPEAEGGRIRLVKAPWNDQWLAEVTGFPFGRHDDQVDSFGVAYRTIRRYDPEMHQIHSSGERTIAKYLRENGCMPWQSGRNDGFLSRRGFR